VQVIGTGIGEDFDIAKLRYHRIIVMTDADVDGAHIRTLVLTFLYRHMEELFERGHVYIAVPPLYLVRMGNQHTYLEKDSQLEDLLVRERFGELEVTARGGTAVKLTEARYSRFSRALTELEGWSARLRSDFGAPAADFVITHRLVENEASSLAEAAALVAQAGENGYSLDSRIDGDSLRVRVVELETSTAADITVPAALFESPIYANLRRAYARLGEVLGGLPPFSISLGKRSGRAETFEALRASAVDIAKQGLQITRFKGLSEMNATELWATAMDPARRMLIRVDVEDAAAASLWFSRLMGDEVEPRREFIEQNALDVRFLDV
jgi:DNA gyrase subunit B